MTDETAADFAKAFAALVGKGRVVVGRDTRPSGVQLESIVVNSLLESGVDVADAGIVATPTIQVLVRHLKAKGGIVITASHNPIQWNGFKFISNKGVFLNSEQNEKLLRIRGSRGFVTSKKRGRETKLKDPENIHIKKVLRAVDVRAIRAMKLKVVIDSCNGAGSVITPKLLKALGCRVIEMNTEIDRPFPRGTEPTPENLTALCAKVKAEKANIGFAQDPDADRLSIVSDKGIAIGEEYTMVLAAKYLLPRLKKKAVIATNLSTSMMIDDVARQSGAKVIRTKVGEINVVEGLMKAKGDFAGEGNGGVIYPKVISSRDSLTGIALVLSLIASEKKKLSKIVDDIPRYSMIKTKFECTSRDEIEDLLNDVKKKFRGFRVDDRDGIKMMGRSSWVHVRPSNTEPVVRIIAEAPTKKEAQKMIERIRPCR